MHQLSDDDSKDIESKQKVISTERKESPNIRNEDTFSMKNNLSEKNFAQKTTI